jgi:(S)-ureidoglycine-glyoxylate aminotransferase
MAVADLDLPARLLAGGGPSSPHPRVLRALGLPVIGQFDPAFTAIMDDVTRCGARVIPVHELDRCSPKLVVAPMFDPISGERVQVRDLASTCHDRGARLVVDATPGLGASELQLDAWHIDICVAGADYALGAPSGMALVTYSPEVEAMMGARRQPPSTSYLDLLQLQAYWSPERLNHHTAPTSLVYGLREALQMVQEEGLEQRWERHRHVGRALHDGLRALGLAVTGDPPYAIAQLPPTTDESAKRRQLLDNFGVHVRRVAGHVWRIGLLGADARHDAAQRVLTAIEKVLAL